MLSGVVFGIVIRTRAGELRWDGTRRDDVGNGFGEELLFPRTERADLVNCFGADIVSYAIEVDDELGKLSLVVSLPLSDGLEVVRSLALSLVLLGLSGWVVVVQQPSSRVLDIASAQGQSAGRGLHGE